MNSPLLHHLPPPPAGKTGWPWTEATPAAPVTLPDGKPWPRISIVTPSFNQGQFIEETIRSVLLQGYPDLEYIIIDGGSTDDSVAVIRKYEPWLSYWVSEKDRGQSHAINKGFEHTTGAIMAWINSDDYYAKGAFQVVPEHLRVVDIVIGSLLRVDVDSAPLVTVNAGQTDTTGSRPFVKNGLTKNFRMCQPSTFWTRAYYDAVGPINEKYNLSMDFDYFIRGLSLGYSPLVLDCTLACFRTYDRSKSGSSRLFAYELSLVFREHADNPLFVKQECLRLARHMLAGHHRRMALPPTNLLSSYCHLVMSAWYDHSLANLSKVFRLLLSRPGIGVKRSAVSETRPAD